jgi:hypothetical protein
MIGRASVAVIARRPELRDRNLTLAPAR